MNTTLPTLLWSLGRSIIARVGEWKAQGGLERTRNLYVKTEVTSLEYDKGVTRYGLAYTNFARDELDWSCVFSFIGEQVESIPEYRTCVAAVSKRCQVSDSQAGFWLSRLAQSLVVLAISDGAKDETLVEHIGLFLADLDGSPVEWRATVWVDGIWLAEEQYQIEEDLLLRRPNPSDIETETRSEMLAGQPTTPYAMSQHSIPSAILEITLRTGDERELDREIRTILDALRLFGLGSVAARVIEKSARSILQSGVTHGPEPGQSVAYRYGIASPEAESLRAFLCSLKHALPTTPTTAAADEVASALSIALDRYRDALLRQGSVHSRITLAITCLEALYLKRAERMELSHRLGQRVSMLLRLLGLNPLKAYNELRRAYSIRSTYIHGSPMGEEQEASPTDLCEAIMEYARISLVAFLQLHNTIEKEALIGKLDNALLDSKALDRVRRIVEGTPAIPGGNV